MNLWFSEIKITVCKKQILRLEFISLPSCQFSHKRASADKATSVGNWMHESCIMLRMRSLAVPVGLCNRHQVNETAGWHHTADIWYMTSTQNNIIKTPFILHCSSHLVAHLLGEQAYFSLIDSSSKPCSCVHKVTQYFVVHVQLFSEKKGTVPSENVIFCCFSAVWVFIEFN